MSTTPDFRALAAEHAQELSGLRRALHRNPELGNNLPQTQQMVLDALEGLPLEVSTGREITSVVAVLRGGRPGPTVLLRGDMDGRRCRRRPGWSTPPRTAPCTPAGTTCTPPGWWVRRVCSARYERSCRTMSCSCSSPARRHRRRAAHALRGSAHRGRRGPSGDRRVRDPRDDRPARGVLCAARDRDGRRERPLGAVHRQGRTRLPARRSPGPGARVAGVRAGVAGHDHPPLASLAASVRTLSTESTERFPVLAEQLADSSATAHGCRAEVEWVPLYPPTINDDAAAHFALETLGEIFGPDRATVAEEPVMGSKGFSFVLKKVPGAFMFLNTTPADVDPATAEMNHSPKVLFDDSILPDQAAALAALAWRRNKRG